MMSNSISIDMNDPTMMIVNKMISSTNLNQKENNLKSK